MKKILALIISSFLFMSNISEAQTTLILKPEIKNNKFPTNYKNNNLDLLFEKLSNEKFNSIQSEFEKESEYIQRMKNIKNEILAKNIKLSDEIYISSKCNFKNYLLEYYISIEEFIFNIKNDNIVTNNELKLNFNSVELSTEILKKDDVKFINSYYIIFLNQFDISSYNKETNFFKIPIKMDSKKAKKMKDLFLSDSLKISYIGTIEFPFYSFFSPDLLENIMRKEMKTQKALYFNLKKIILSDDNTGEIYYSLVL